MGALGTFGCSEDPDADDAGNSDGPSRDTADFISDDPAPQGGRGGGDPGAGTSGASDGGENGAPDGDDDDDDGGGERELSEADIVVVEGDTLYALSRYGGLSILDISNPAEITSLGRYRTNSTPFEMYVEDGRVFLMLSDYGEYVWLADEGGYRWVSQSKLLALDARDPANIILQGEFSLPGSVQDSRRVGEVLYVVTHEYGGCWGCDAEPNTTITSLDISDRTAIQRVDELSFENTESSDGQYWGWSGERSVSSTNERMYVSGVEYGGQEDATSTIDVVDISDPSGTMVMGASVTVAGQVQSRWQMDEYDGALRVVSQPWQWQSGSPPVIETFSVQSAQDVTPLASLPMVLPRPETLQSVRFDGDRGYAITFEQTDPLFTLDLSDPAQPLQVGELEIPGWVHHMEPRGDRIIGLGFDREHPDGSINVSIFDVSEMSTPTMLSRVHFGGDWAYFAEDQNRIHKTLQLLETEGLILIPFSGWEWEDSNVCSSRSTGGIQLIDWEPDALALRGVAEGEGQVRRALMHRDHLMSISDLAVQSYDITDRDAPDQLDSSALAVNVSAVEAEGDIVIRFSQDWWSDAQFLEVVPASDPGTSDPLGRLNLQDAIAAQNGDGECSYNYYSTQMAIHGGFAYILRKQYWYDYGTGTDGMRMDVVDVRAPATPTYVRTVTLPFASSYFYPSQNGFIQPETDMVIAGNYMLFHRQTWAQSGDEYSYDYGYGESEASVEIVNLVDPSTPAYAGSLARDNAALHGGLQVYGNTVTSWSKQPVEDDPSRVRYFLERFQVGATSVTSSDPLNVPGVVVAYDEASQVAITVDHRVEAQSVAREECYSNPRYFDIGENDVCLLSRRTLWQVDLSGPNVTVMGSAVVEDADVALVGVFSSPERLFVELQRGGWRGYYGYYGDYGGYDGEDDGPSFEVAVFASWQQAALQESGRVDLGSERTWYGTHVAAGNSLIFGSRQGIGKVDATNPAAPVYTAHESFGYGCQDIEIVGNQVLCALGTYGLQSFPLND